MYIVVLIDWYAHFMLRWALDQSLAMGFVLDAVDRALIVSQPEIWKSDQVTQFKNLQYIDRPETHDIQLSMVGHGQALDNGFRERLWRSVKYEEIYFNDYQTPRETRNGGENYFEFYNYYRPQQPLQYQTPTEVYLPSENIV